MPLASCVTATTCHPTIPERFNIEVNFNKNSGRIEQILNEDIKGHLMSIYGENENIGYLREDNKLARRYHTDLLSYIEKFLKCTNIKSILEIGCGGCTILKELQRLDYDVTGIDPSPFARACAIKENIELIEDFFRAELIQKHYDLVFFSDVLEHVFNPKEFLVELKQTLIEILIFYILFQKLR